MAFPIPLPLSIRQIVEDVDKRLARLPTPLNEYGYDPYGLSPSYARELAILATLVYRYYFRVETRGIENLPPGRALVIGNHAGNTVPYDGMMLGLALFLEADPPRWARGMVEFYLPKIMWWSEFIHRLGAVVGTPENCVQLLEQEEVVMVFPEGYHGFIKPYTQAYRLQRFGTGFVRLALQTRTPVVPVGIVGSEEQSPGLYDSKFLARLINSPALAITVTWPWFGPLGYLIPLPVKYRIRVGEPILFEGDPNEPDAAVEQKAQLVKDRISLLIEEGLAERQGWFA
jgi:1-acyl-sn-glycerol-3-phosphate acyltransferase